jgi:hypothetical protein
MHLKNLLQPSRFACSMPSATSAVVLGKAARPRPDWPQVRSGASGWMRGRLLCPASAVGQPAEPLLHSLELARTIGSAEDEARALVGLGRCAAATGHTSRAKTLLQQAHVILQLIGTADAPALLAELKALPSPGPRE